MSSVYSLYLAKILQDIFTAQKILCIIHIFIIVVNNFIHQADQFNNASLCIIHNLYISVKILSIKLGNKLRSIMYNNCLILVDNRKVVNE